MSLCCNDFPNCGFGDNSDEKNCKFNGTDHDFWILGAKLLSSINGNSNRRRNGRDQYLLIGWTPCGNRRCHSTRDLHVVSPKT